MWTLWVTIIKIMWKLETTDVSAVIILNFERWGFAIWGVSERYMQTDKQHDPDQTVHAWSQVCVFQYSSYCHRRFKTVKTYFLQLDF